jgi:glutathione peroxidase
MTSLHDFEMTSITGESVPLGSYAGQLCLVVNVASACGLTPQYEGLVSLHEDNDDLTVLGFPCNQFAGQEPGTDDEICEFATSKYAVSFPMFSKIEVNGDDADPLYQWLKAEQPGDGDASDINWNFEKFLVDGDGKVVARFSPMVTPAEIAEQLDSYR